jgi:transcriptional regulator with XRE-family HTH domain
VRECANMSQAVFARLLNVTTGYVSQLEREQSVPRPGARPAARHQRKGIRGVLTRAVTLETAQVRRVAWVPACAG